MASPHAAGVAALIVSRHGKKQRHGGFGMAPDQVEQHLYRTAAEHACPEPRLQPYRNEGRDAEFDALLRRWARTSTASTATASSTPTRR